LDRVANRGQIGMMRDSGWDGVAQITGNRALILPLVVLNAAITRVQ
jgi:hypothetical protein